MTPLIPLAAAGTGLFFYLRSRKHAQASGVTPGGSAVKEIKGKSGETWEASILPALSTGDSKVAEIVYLRGSVPAQKHMVIRYSQLGSDTSNRKLIATNPNTSPGLIQAAIADFGVTK